MKVARLSLNSVANVGSLMVASLLVGFLLGMRSGSRPECGVPRVVTSCMGQGIPKVVKEPKTGEQCDVRLKYAASEWEKKWVSGIETWQGDDRRADVEVWKTPGGGCEKIKEDIKFVDQFEQLMSSSNPPEQVFSHFKKEILCKDKPPAAVNVPIEPLVGFLRHPRAVCLEPDWTPRERNRRCISSNYKCLTYSKEYMMFPKVQDIDKGERIYFDMGASRYSSGPGDASQKWIVESYGAKGIVFDRILAWEANPQDPKAYWADVPPHVKPAVSFYNIPVSSNPGSPDYPWTYVKSLCTPESYCVVKIDIDNPTIEETLIAHLQADPSLWALVDELFWEHHVLRSPLTWPGGWGQDTLQMSTKTLAESYKIFSELRERGIRAHSWV